MGREKTPLKREYKEEEVTINIRDIFRNPDIQDNVIKEVKKIAKRKKKCKTMDLSTYNENGNDANRLLVATVFSFNEAVVWDSHFGYEIGYFLGEGHVYETWAV